MTAKRKKNKSTIPIDRPYASVEELMLGEGISKEVRQEVALISQESRLSHLLTKMRHRADMTQSEMAKALKVSQGTISKIENSLDADLDFGIICKYALETNQRISLNIGKPLNHVEAVKHHAGAMREHLLELAKLANEHEDDENMEQEIHSFFGETLLNVLQIVGSCANELPRGREFEIRMRIEEEKKADRPNTQELPDPVRV